MFASQPFPSMGGLIVPGTVVVQQVHCRLRPPCGGLRCNSAAPSSAVAKTLYENGTPRSEDEGPVRGGCWPSRARGRSMLLRCCLKPVALDRTAIVLADATHHGGRERVVAGWLPRQSGWSYGVPSPYNRSTSGSGRCRGLRANRLASLVRFR